MRKDLPKRLVRAIEEKGDNRHSDVYRWLRRHHARLSPLLSRHRPSWKVLAEEIALAGVTGLRGQKATAPSVRRIWYRLCRDLEAAERQRRAGGVPKTTPSPRAPAGWRPPVAPAVGEQPRSAPVPTRADEERAPLAPAVGSTGSTDRSRMTPEERMADLRRVIDSRSGR